MSLFKIASVITLSSMVAFQANAMNTKKMKHSYSDFSEEIVQIAVDKRKSVSLNESENPAFQKVLQRLIKGSFLEDHFNNPYPVVVTEQVSHPDYFLPEASMKVGVLTINDDMMKIIENEDELAAVLGHELLHHTLAHDLKVIEKSKSFLFEFFQSRAQGGSIALIKEQNFSAEIAGKMMEGLKDDNEIEVDRLLPYLLKNAGYKPVSILELNKRLLDSTKDLPPFLLDGYTRSKLIKRFNDIRQTIIDEKMY